MCFLQIFDCKNHVRVIQSMEQGDRLYVCGTNAHNPKDYVIYVSPADWEAICHLPFAVFHSCSHTKDCHRQLTLDGNHQLLTQPLTSMYS